MNKVVVGAAVLAVVAGGGVAVAGWTGSKVADELHAETAKVLETFPGLKVVEHKVNKGLLSSTHELTIEAGCATVPESDAPAGTTPSGPLQFTWRDRISHGPIPGGRAVGLAMIDSELVLPPKAAAAVAKVLGDKPAFTARTVVGFGGSYVAELDSPAFKYAEEGKGSMEWQGVHAVMRGNLRQGIAGGGTYVVDAPGFQLSFTDEATPVTVKIGPINMAGGMKPQAGATAWWMAAGKGTASIKSLELTTARPGSGADGKPLSIVFDGLQFTSETTLDNGFLSGVSQFTGKGRVDDFAIDKVEMQVSMRRLHAATYQQIVNRVLATAFSCDKAARESLQQAANAEMEKGLVTLLQHNPEYSLDKFAVELGGQRAELSYLLGTRGVTEADSTVPLPVLFSTKGFATASVKVQMGWIEQITKKIGALQMAAEPGDAKGEAATSLQSAQTQMLATVNMMIDQFATQGFVQREGDLVKSSVKFEGGQLTVNDKPMGMPMMGGK